MHDRYQVLRHRTNDCNKQIRINKSLKERTTGLSTSYHISIDQGAGKDPLVSQIKFHIGPVANGVNGLTHEALLAIVIDRLTDAQNTRFACAENNHALRKVEEALMWLNERTNRRLDEGVEGTHESDKAPNARPKFDAGMIADGKISSDPMGYGVAMGVDYAAGVGIPISGLVAGENNVLEGGVFTRKDGEWKREREDSSKPDIDGGEVRFVGHPDKWTDEQQSQHAARDASPMEFNRLNSQNPKTEGIAVKPEDDAEDVMRNKRQAMEAQRQRDFDAEKEREADRVPTTLAEEQEKSDDER